MREETYLEQAVGVQRPAGHCRHLAPVGAVTRVGHPHIHHLKQGNGQTWSHYVQYDGISGKLSD